MTAHIEISNCAGRQGKGRKTDFVETERGRVKLSFRLIVHGPHRHSHVHPRLCDIRSIEFERRVGLGMSRNVERFDFAFVEEELLEGGENENSGSLRSGSSRSSESVDVLFWVRGESDLQDRGDTLECHE